MGYFKKKSFEIFTAGFCAVLLWGGSFSSADPAAGGPVRAALFITGLSGSNQFEEYFKKAPELIRKTLLANGYRKENLVNLSEKASDGKLWGRDMISTKENIDLELSRFSLVPEDYEEVFVFIAGHANGRDEESVMHLPGDDMTFADLMEKIDMITAKRVFVVVAAAQGDIWIKKLGRPGRVIIAGNGDRQYDFVPMIFLRLFPRVFYKGARNAETGQNGNRSSLRDIFSETQQKIKRWYANNKLQCTELALIDADGDGKGESLLKDFPPIEKTENAEIPEKPENKPVPMVSGSPAGSPSPAPDATEEFPLNLDVPDAKAADVIYFNIPQGEIA